VVSGSPLGTTPHDLAHVYIKFLEGAPIESKRYGLGSADWLANLQLLVESSNLELAMICDFCKKEISPGDQKYISKQAGMEGTYHWSCFIQVCKQARKQGDDFSDSSILDGDIELSLLD
jgi:hypothetical protein